MSKIAEQIYNQSVYEQEKTPEYLINVGYGFKRNKHNLQDVKKIAESRIRRYAISLKYNIITQKEYDNLLAINNQLIKSVDYTINFLYNF